MLCYLLPYLLTNCSNNGLAAHRTIKSPLVVEFPVADDGWTDQFFLCWWVLVCIKDQWLLRRNDHIWRRHTVYPQPQQIPTPLQPFANVSSPEGLKYALTRIYKYPLFMNDAITAGWEPFLPTFSGRLSSSSGSIASSESLNCSNGRPRGRVPDASWP